MAEKQATFPMMLDAERAKYVNRELKYEETIAALRQELTDSQKQVTLLRDAIRFYMKAEGDYDLIKADKNFTKTLAATADLDGLILCHAEPVGWCGTSGVGELIVSKSKVWNFLTTPLYRAWEPK